MEELIKLIEKYHGSFKEREGDFDNYRATKKYNNRVNYHHKKMLNKFSELGIDTLKEQIEYINKYAPKEGA